MATITVHRALTRLKTLDAQIKKETANLNAVAISVGDRKRMVGIGRGAASPFSTVQEAEASISASFKSLKALIELRSKIKSAVMASNAKTFVTVNGVKMTVQEAVERKNSIEYDKNLAATLYTQHASAMRMMDELNAQFQNKVEQSVSTLVGRDSNTKVDEAQISVLRDAQAKVYAPSLVDPLGIAGEISKMSNDINGFLEEVDAVLVESNAKTEIDI